MVSGIIFFPPFYIWGKIAWRDFQAFFVCVWPEFGSWQYWSSALINKQKKTYYMCTWTYHLNLKEMVLPLSSSLRFFKYCTVIISWTDLANAMTFLFTKIFANQYKHYRSNNRKNTDNHHGKFVSKTDTRCIAYISICTSPKQFDTTLIPVKVNICLQKLDAK